MGLLRELSKLPPLGMGDMYGDPLYQEALKGNATLRTTGFSGRLVKPLREYLDSLVAAGGRILATTVKNKDAETPSSATVVWDEAAVTVQYHSWSQDTSVSISALDEHLLKRLADLSRGVVDSQPKGKVSVVMTGSSGPYLQSIGTASEKLVESNYAPHVIEMFDHIVEDINNEHPCGRLSIFDGEPGTGKTFLIRALLSRCPRAHFIILNSDMVTEIAGPSLLGVLTNTRASADKDPMVLLIEDADKCLVSRQADNASAISTLLNMGDGILGAMLNVRIIATTNAGHIKDSSKMDPAVTRSGRLCRRIHVGKLPAAQANQRLKELTNGREFSVFSGPTNLSDVYKRAIDPTFVGETTLTSKKSGGMGFAA